MLKAQSQYFYVEAVPFNCKFSDSFKKRNLNLYIEGKPSEKSI